MVVYGVVYHLHPTSNRNTNTVLVSSKRLYIIFILHQTATWYCKSTHNIWLYIIFILHQTATQACFKSMALSCISSSSYIKPQHIVDKANFLLVVYHLHPTSNRNGALKIYSFDEVVYHLHPTSNRNKYPSGYSFETLYIIFILHQTATYRTLWWYFRSCISSSSYIKPQPNQSYSNHFIVVYHLHPTSNRNLFCAGLNLPLLYIIFILHQTATRLPLL